MRDHSTLMYVGLIMVFGIFSILLMPDSAKVITLIAFLVLMAIIGWYMYYLAKMREESPTLYAHGFKTSLEDSEPKATRPWYDPEHPDDPPVIMDLYRNGGIQAIGKRGGGDSGYTWARRDMTVRLEGDRTQILILANPGDVYYEDAPVGGPYFPLSALDPELKKATLADPEWNFRGHVSVYCEPLGQDPLADIDKLKGFSWKAQTMMKNTEIETLKKQLVDEQKRNVGQTRNNLRKVIREQEADGVEEER